MPHLLVIGNVVKQSTYSAWPHRSQSLVLIVDVPMNQASGGRTSSERIVRFAMVQVMYSSAAENVHVRPSAFAHSVNCHIPYFAAHVTVVSYHSFTTSSFGNTSILRDACFLCK